METGAPLAGVQVSANTRSVVTDAAGATSLPMFQSVCSHRCQQERLCQCLRRSQYGRQWPNGALAQTCKGITGPATSAIFGIVISGRDGRPVADAEVYVSGMRSYSAVTDAAGRYRIDGLAAGNYSVTISHTGFTAATANSTCLREPRWTFTGAQ